MVLGRFRRFAWLLILILVTGLATPMFASAAPVEAIPVAMTHQHADGFVHSHGGQVGHGSASTSANRNSGNSPHCPGCLTDAACAVSCLGLAVLPFVAEWTVPPSVAAWNPAASSVRPGVAPMGDIDPPRPVLHS